MRLRSVVVSVALTILGVPRGGIATQEVEQSIQFTITSPRVLADAVAKLQVRTQTVVTFEEAPLEWRDDVVDKTDEAKLAAAGGRGARFVIPRGGTHTFNVPAGSVAAGLSALLSQYNESGFPGEYTVRATGSTLHVVPAASRDASGQRRQRTSILDTMIDIPQAEYDGLSLVERVLAGVTAASGYRAQLATVTTSTYGQTTISIPRGRYVARDLLLRVVESAHEPVTWRLFYDPITRSYFMNLHGIRREPVRSSP